MKIASLFLIALLSQLSHPGVPKVKTPLKNLKITFICKESERKIDVMADGKLFTSYCWFENVYKPVLYPVFTAGGKEITRGFPLKPKVHERMDHLHQIGIWLNYGNVNGFDFWGNGSTGKKNPDGGEIKHISFEKLSAGEGEGILVTNESWIIPSGEELLAEKTEYHFLAEGSLRIIDRITTLTATNKEVTFKDTKEGMFGIRVARQLELPSSDQENLLDEHGNISSEKAGSNIEVTGNYKSSEGSSGEEVWGKRARWMNLFGKIGNENISITVLDHPLNPGYPTYWHARGYGLFAANPLGVKDFIKGADSVNFKIKSQEFKTFRYRVIINSGKYLNDAEINAIAIKFANRY